MIPGTLIRVNPYRYMTGFYKLLMPEEYSRELRTGRMINNTLALEPGMICLVLGKEKYIKDTYCKILVGDQICYMHHSLYNGDNFQIIRSEAS